MAKKESWTFTAIIVKNTEKGGAWIAKFNNQTEETGNSEVTAWANASAAKRWVKSMVVTHTTRKSVKMTPAAEVDAKGKPILFHGQLTYKA